jgi:hypothetical protein
MRRGYRPTAYEISQTGRPHRFQSEISVAPDIEKYHVLALYADEHVACQQILRHYKIVVIREAKTNARVLQKTIAVSHGGGVNSYKKRRGKPFVTFDACPQSSSATASVFLPCSVSIFTLFTAISLDQKDDQFPETAARLRSLARGPSKDSADPRRAEKSG